MSLKIKLGNSVKKYIRYQSPERLTLFRTLSNISEKLPETVIFGGMLREFSLGNAKKFTSDIDLVSLASSKEIFNAIKHFEPTRNKFGGYRFYVEKQLYDIWSFEDTWAFREGLVKGQSFDDLFHTTFFNLDAAIFHLTKDKCLIADSYQNWVKSSLLELNLQENPNPSTMYQKALNLAIDKNLAVGPKLATFLIKHKKISSSDNLLCDIFFRGLESHNQKTPEENYIFQPQKSFLSN